MHTVNYKYAVTITIYDTICYYKVHGLPMSLAKVSSFIRCCESDALRLFSYVLRTDSYVFLNKY
jgi:hypothetical protein